MAKKIIVVLALVVSLGCVETTVVVTATPRSLPETSPTNTPVFVATAAPLPTSTPAPTMTPVSTWTPLPPAPTPQVSDCDPSYPDVCIPSPPPDLDCGEITYRRFRVLPPDPRRFDGDHDGIGCER